MYVNVNLHNFHIHVPVHVPTDIFLAQLNTIQVNSEYLKYGPEQSAYSLRQIVNIILIAVRTC